MPGADPSDLYGLPLDRFVAERGALAKALRGAGDKDEAARVAARELSQEAALGHGARKRGSRASRAGRGRGS